MTDLKIEFGNVMAEVTGEEDGLSRPELDKWEKPLAEIVSTIQAGKEAGKLEFMTLPYEEESLIPPLERFAAEAQEKFDNFVVVGIGGSALGPKALLSALAHPFYNLLEKEKRGGKPRMFFPDNVDPDLIGGLLDIIDPTRTLFNVISKSGSTVETVANFMVFYQLLAEKLDSRRVREHLVITTDPLEGSLRKLATEVKIASFFIPPGVGGRFSIFTPVGLLPAALAGLDSGGLLAGARRMDELCRSPSIWENPALLCAFLNYWFDKERGRNILVIMPYAQRLWDLADWFRQLWAESLGKEKKHADKTEGVGSTPVKALGATDQHSQVQLYMEGPPDKLFVFLRAEEFSRSMDLPAAPFPMEEADYLQGKSLNQLLLAEQTATQTALAQKARPNYAITLPQVDAFSVGELIFLLEMSTAYAGELYGVNAFDQPGVEAGKKLAKGLMGKAGFEKERTLVEEFSSRGGTFVCPSSSPLQ